MFGNYGAVPGSINMGVSVTEVEISEFVSAAALLATYPSYVNPIQVP